MTKSSYDKPTNEQKRDHVINNNTFFYSDCEFEQEYEGEISSLTETLLGIKNEIDNHGLKKTIFEDLLKEKENGLNAILALTGISNETFKRLITFIRVVEDQELSNLLLKERWAAGDDVGNVKEWSDAYISKLIKSNSDFRKAIVNLFFKGSTVPLLAKRLPLFEFKKLSMTKVNFEIPGMIDTLVRYKSKGSYSAQGRNNPETVIKKVLADMKVPFVFGELPELAKNEPTLKRTMDFIIPNKERPLIIIECSFLTTTSSGQGDKAKVEVNVRSLIKKEYPEAKFIGFVDGIGWLVRKNDLLRMVEAYEEVFTFKESDIIKFKELVKKVVNQQ